MAMSASTMANSITAAIKAVNPDADEAFLKTYWEPICQGIIDEIVASATTETVVDTGSSAGTYSGTVTS